MRWKIEWGINVFIAAIYPNTIQKRPFVAPIPAQPYTVWLDAIALGTGICRSRDEHHGHAYTCFKRTRGVVRWFYPFMAWQSCL